MTSDEKEGLNQALSALDRLLRMFQAERILYLIVTVASFVMFMYGGIKVLTEKDVSVEKMTALLGGSGLATAASSRVTFFLNKAFGITEDIIRKLTGTVK